MKPEINERLTRIGPQAPCGALMRHYWQPVALLAEFDPALDPRMRDRPVKAVRVLGQDFVLFKNAAGTFGLLDRDCPHRGADLAFGRNEGDGLRCPFHGWKFDVSGQCIETPAEPEGSRLCSRIKQRSYPLMERSGVLFAWLGEAGSSPPPFPELDCFTAPDTHTFAFKGLWQCNWLQAFEVGVDPAHASFLHRFFVDESMEDSYGKQFRGASAGDVDGEQWPMTKVMREFDQPKISVASMPYGMQLTALRAMNASLTHVRVTHSIFPHTFVIPLSETMTITQMHVPVDDTNTYWYAVFTSFDGPVDKEAMRAQRLQGISLPDYIPKTGRHNHWGFNEEEQLTRTYLGMGESDINVHDQWACESMGPIQDRSREHLGTTDVAIMANRRVLMKAIDDVAAGRYPPGVAQPEVAAQRVGPDTVDGIAPADNWEQWWQTAVDAKCRRAAWHEKHGS
ncbi:MAG: aromatic ring-hydroxylating dioxygenase subunit alpha [Burkholderiaceae bacterium]|jgi:phthalate 4,5-dioxygenase oxygenase subunit|nr:aromatic ring-hydroxylating dioxygenase subunit alpha [Betaproteobacteria bacterium]MDA9076057.1 aromatic ring-hydroxylating dioxygenase subunit alpha [Burkholderiaceae bacterium]MDA9884242.1 aromatic ring-hydroxylating dioxygenase subunit alpha [Burkholderiaceae bacterium]MDG1109800.1 aromatic ring-hydroxylating dioxygenase subunit alpha [Burkholderiaceae bacterium]MDO7552389.1 aromatic ring-hydroxylating dioxygenase subunit alpha [Burkholderiaceae bacterium]